MGKFRRIMSGSSGISQESLMNCRSPQGGRKGREFVLESEDKGLSNHD